MKSCELCPAMAQMYCESDDASLCFDCDAKVHGANFLVARHSRALLCRRCQDPTPWKADGPRLGPTVSLCERCVTRRSTRKMTGGEEDEGESGERERVEEDHDDGGDGGDDDDGGDGDDEMEEEEEGEEQVVPWAMDPPPVASSSSSEEESVGPRIGNGLLKRMRQNVDLPSSSCSSQGQLCCSSSSRPSYLPNRTALPNSVRTVGADNEATSDSCRPLKNRKKEALIPSGSHQLSVDFVSFGSSRPPI